MIKYEFDGLTVYVKFKSYGSRLRFEKYVFENYDGK